MCMLGAVVARSSTAQVNRYVSHGDAVIALVDVTVLDGTAATARRHQTIILNNGRIADIGPADSISIPGLVGMHDHMHMPGITFMGYTAPRLWLASGVTTVQTAGSAEPVKEAALARAIAKGDSVGPTIFPTAHYVTGPDGNGPMTKPGSEEEARKFVRDGSRAGATWFKLYRHVEPHIARAVIHEAHAQGRRVTGHLCSLTFGEAARMGIDSIEHGLISATDFVTDKPEGACVSSREAATELDLGHPDVSGLIDLLVQENVTLTSTLAITESHFPHRPQADERTLALFSPAYRARYDERQRTLAASAATTRMTPDLLAKFMAFERMFVAAGGRLVMGPDPGRHVLPGYGNQRGFELLVEAGFSASEAVQIASYNGAQALGTDDRSGRLAPGFDADLVVLMGDLTEDPTVIRNVEIVFKRGTGYDPKKLIADVVGQIGIR
ncbi:MAG: amidohydrolase [Bacteroidetes bacterium CG12_big_fil_rev_8_21_14_0_65_60_17]|nr:MAG: amidohydrolase [Bacteroidetes bacterium CG12_big_fil_rev_8_21_14_0_65_60_17]